MGDVAQSGFGGHRGGSHDPPVVLFYHVREHRPGRLEYTRQADAQHLFPLIVGHVRYMAHGNDSMVGDQYIDLAELLDAGRHHFVHSVGVPGVCNRRVAVAAQIFNHPFGLLQVHVAAHLVGHGGKLPRYIHGNDIGPLVRKGQCMRTPLTPAAPRDQHHPTVEFAHSAPPIVLQPESALDRRRTPTAPNSRNRKYSRAAAGH